MTKRIRRRSTNRVSNLFNTISGHSNSLGNYTNSIVSATIISFSKSPETMVPILVIALRFMS